MDDRARLLDLTERIIYLRSIPVAAILPPPVLKVLATNFRERRFARGELLMQEGRPIRALHLLIDGKVSLIKGGRAFGQLTPPQSLGFLGIIAGGDGTYDATAETEVHSLELDAETMIELMEDHFEFFRATLRYLCERFVAELEELPAEILQSRLDGVDAILPEHRPLELVERMAWLRALSVFNETNLNGLAVMAMTVTERRFQPGERIWSAGEHAGENLFVLAGRARCRTPDGLRVWRAGPSSAIGGLEAVAERPRWYDLFADTNLVVLRLPNAAFLDLLEDDFPMATAFMRRISRDVLQLLEAKAARGANPTQTLRSVTNLGPVPVGA